MSEPFWAAGYRNPDLASVFGQPSEEIVDVVQKLPAGSSYLLEDEHPGGVRHRHPVNKVVAQKPERAV